jgi:hypothetical protein
VNDVEPSGMPKILMLYEKVQKTIAGQAKD